MATHSSVLAWRIPWTEGPGGYSPRGCKELDVTQRLSTRVHLALDRVLGIRQRQDDTGPWSSARGRARPHAG